MANDILQQALQYYQHGNFAQAKQTIDQVPEQSNPDLLHFKGVIYLQYGMHNADQQSISIATRCIKAALQLNDNYEYQLNLSTCYQQLQQYQAAIDILTNLRSLKPDDINATFNLANIYHAQEIYSEAIPLYEQVLQQHPHHYGAALNYGLSLIKTREDQKALDFFLQQLQLQPNNEEFLFNAASCLFKLERYSESLTLFKKVLSINPSHIMAQRNISILYLQAGDFANGWPEFENRWQWPEIIEPFLNLPKPIWLGQNLEHDKKLLIWSEQGIGDMILYLTLLPELNSKVKNIVVALPQKLHAAIRRSYNVPIIDFSTIKEYSAYDYHIPLGSILQYLRPNVASFRYPTQLLQADPNLVATTKTKFASNNRFYVGISWLGGPQEYHYMRSLELKKLHNVFGNKNITFVNLQHGEHKDELKHLPKNIDFIDLDYDPITNLDQHLATISCLDLIITVDNSNAHFAGSMGKSCWVMLTKQCHWQWQLTRNDSIWYANTRLFRQNKFEDWSNVIIALNNSLQDFTRQKIHES